MNRHLHLLPAFLTLCFLWAACGHRGARPEVDTQKAASAGDRGTVLVFADPHFDPYFDPTLLPDLFTAELSDWPRIFARSTAKGSGSLGEDLSPELFAAGLDAMRSVAPNPDFVLVPGDFLVHHFVRDFNGHWEQSGLAPVEGAQADRERQRFANKTMRFVMHEIRLRYPEATIVPVLGNNDSACGNYFFEPESVFLRELAQTWQEFFPERANRESFLRTFPTAGHYTVEAPRGNFRLIVLNTVLWSRSYENKCGSKEQNPAAEAFIWLEEELARAEREQRLAWLVLHIPPGIDTYETLDEASESPDGELHPIYFWQEPHHHRFVELVQRYQQQISAIIAGHIHSNSFQLLGHRERGTADSAAFVRLVPALSPVYNNNPAFKVFHHDRREGRLLDYDVYHLDLASYEEGWHLEYSFSQVYGHDAINTESLEKIYYDLLEDPQKMIETYGRYHKASSAKPEIHQGNWPIYWITIGQLETERFEYWLEALSED